jgi:hypothetical protein
MSGIKDFKENEQLLLQRFREIDPQEHRNIVAYYEENQDSIHLLPHPEQLRIQRSYISALFELGDYNNYLEYCSGYIDKLFDGPMQKENWRSDLCDCLFKKAVSEYHNGQLDSSERTAVELLKLDPDFQGLRQLIIKIYLSRRIDILQGISAITIFSTILAAAVIAVELFYIRPFVSSWIIAAEWLRISLFSFSVVHFFVAHSILRLWMKKEADQKIRTLSPAKDY